MNFRDIHQKMAKRKTNSGVSAIWASGFNFQHLDGGFSTTAGCPRIPLNSETIYAEFTSVYTG